MKKFVVIYYASTSAVEATKKLSPEEMKKGMDAWKEWAKKCSDSLFDLGNVLTNGQVITESGSSPTNNEVTGYSILQAENMEEAKKMLIGHPHLGWITGCSIEIYEEIPMPLL